MADSGGEAMIEVTLNKPLVPQEMEGEIIEVQGFVVGFIEAGQPPYVLEVEPGTEMALHGVRADDILASIDGRDTCAMSRDEVAAALRTCTRLDFRHIAVVGTVDMDSSEDEAHVALHVGTEPGAVPMGAPPAGEAVPMAQQGVVDVGGSKAPTAESGLKDSVLGKRPAEGVLQDASLVHGGALETVVNDEPPIKRLRIGEPNAEGELRTVVKETPAAASGAAAAPAQNPVLHTLQTGMAVRLVGFTSAAMNGARGKLGKFSQAKGVWQVFLENAKAAKAVKPANLEALGPGEDHTLQNLPVAAAPPVKSAVAPAAPPANNGIISMGLPQYPAPGGNFTPVGAPPPAPAMPQWQGDPAAAAIVEFSSEEALPFDFDHNGWLELLRDGYLQGLRTDQEYPDPPPFHRAFEFVAEPGPPGTPIPRDKLPKSALNMQLQILMRKRGGEDAPPVNQARGGKPPGKGGGGGNWRPWSPWQPMSWGYGKSGGGKAFAGKGGGNKFGKGGGNNQVLPGLLGALGQVAAAVAAGQVPAAAQAPKAGIEPAASAPAPATIEIPKADGGTDY